ncbi:MAG: Smr/MutS family protein [Synergistaceae bacterium]|nr:Smr/MutS family protein [Synergistaceae bacterium]
MLLDNSVIEILELDKNLLPFRENLRGELGELVLSNLAPCEDFDSLIKRDDLLREWLDLIDNNGEFKFNASLEAVSPMFAGAKKSGILSGEELLRVRLLLQAARNLREGLAPISSKYKSVENLRHGIRDFAPEIDALNVIEDSGRLSDNASHKLSELRSEIENLKRNARRISQKLFEDSNILNMLQERAVSWREGRFLFLVRQEYINRFPGLAVERSASGNSVYMEPRALSSINNSLIIKSRDEHDEERIILLGLTRNILSRENAIINAERIIGTFDLLCACDYLIRVKKWVRPELTRDKIFKLVGARHPMLKDKAVPIDIYCGGDKNFNSLVITGSNTGGKTVTLKTVGVLIILAWLGLPVPARDGTIIGTFDSIFADIGDEQSIEQNLSTFSSHLKKIIYILKQSTDKSLILLDELGAGTDPHEGAALGVAILETLREKGCITLATTHHNPIKQYALTTQGVETASMEFNIERLEPTYKLLMGVPGRSSALLIAKRYGMPEKVLKLAQGSLDSRELTAEDIMSELNERRAALDNAEKEFQDKLHEAENLREQYQSRVKEIDYQRDKIMKAADLKAEKFIARAEETSKDIIRSMEQSARDLARKGYNVKRRELKTLRDLVDKRHQKRTEREIENSPKPFNPAPGVTAMVAGSGFVGIINEIKNGRAYMTSGPLNIDVPVSQLIATDKKAKIATPPIDTSHLLETPSVPPSIMVRGMLVGEAMPLVENYLDRAYRANHSVVTIIHGRGEGILRREVHSLCSRLSYVKDFRLGGEGEGGFGVTIVTFK